MLFFCDQCALFKIKIASCLFVWYNIIINQPTRKKDGYHMPGAADIIKDYVSEFSRLQNWMIAIRCKDSSTYDSMHDRCIELKVTLSSLVVELTELDKIKE